MNNSFNPVAFLQQALMGGKGLPDALQQIAAQGGRYAQVVNMIKGKNAQELQTYAQNLAKEYGVNLDELLRGIGLNIPQQIDNSPRLKPGDSRLNGHCLQEQV